MAKRIFDLPETKGQFRLRGKVSGTTRDSFFKEIETKNKKMMYMLQFGCQVDTDSTVYVDLNGMERDKAYFYKRPAEKGGKGEVKEVAWSQRNTFDEEGFELIGIRVGLEKYIDDKGKERNKIETFTEMDACDSLAEKLIEGESVFVRGNIEFSSFKNKKDEITRSSKFVPSQIYSATDIDFEDEEFVPTRDFEQIIVFVGIQRNDEDKDDIKFLVEAKIVTYSTIEDAEFVIRDEKLAKLFKKNLKPYTAIKVSGIINNKVIIEEENEDEYWGEKSAFDTVAKTFIRELEITGAVPSTIDKETYSESEIEKALELIAKNNKAKDEFNGNDSWGNNQDFSKENDDEDDGWD